MNNARRIHFASIPQRQAKRPDAIRLLALLLVACLALAPSALALNPDAYEPNDSLGAPAALGRSAPSALRTSHCTRMTPTTTWLRQRRRVP